MKNRSSLTNDCWLKINKDASWYVLPRSRLAEEGTERVSSDDSSIRNHLPVRLYPVLVTVQLPASVADLDPSLTDVKRYALSLKGRE